MGCYSGCSIQLSEAQGLNLELRNDQSFNARTPSSKPCRCHVRRLHDIGQVHTGEDGDDDDDDDGHDDDDDDDDDDDGDGHGDDDGVVAMVMMMTMVVVVVVAVAMARAASVFASYRHITRLLLQFIAAVLVTAIARLV